MSFLTDGLRIGAFNDRPPVAREGTVFSCTDAPIEFVYKRGAWQGFIGAVPLKAPPDISTWTSSVNATQNGYQAINKWGGTWLSAQTLAAGAACIIKRSVPNFPYQLTVGMLVSMAAASGATKSDFPFAGIAWRQSSTGNLHVFSALDVSTIGVNPVAFLRSYTASGSGATGITYTIGVDSQYVTIPPGGQGIIFLRVADDGINRVCSVSGMGGVEGSFVPVTSVTRTTQITPDEIGLIVGSAPTGNTCNVSAFFAHVEIVPIGATAGIVVPGGTQQLVRAPVSPYVASHLRRRGGGGV